MTSLREEKKGESCEVTVRITTRGDSVHRRRGPDGSVGERQNVLVEGRLGLGV